MKNVLLLGNGFDISFGLPTKYTDFVLVIRYLIMNENHLPEEVSLILEQAGVDCIVDYAVDQIIAPNDVRQLISFSKKNMWIKYFIHLMSLDTNHQLWLDFEQEMSKINHLFKISIEKSLNDRQGVISVSLKDRNTPENTELYKFVTLFEEFFDPYNNRIGVSWACRFKEIYMIDATTLNPDLIIHRLYNEYLDLSRLLQLYLHHFVDIPIQNNVSFFKNIYNHKYDAINSVLSFNYTHTFELVDDIGTHIKHLHGELKDGKLDNNIVLGYDEDVRNSTDTRWLRFKKYYQRTYCKTSELLSEFKAELQNTHDIELLIIGFSFGKIDSDILMNIIDLVDRIYVYCHKPDVEHDYIENIIKSYGGSEYIRLQTDKHLSFLVGNSELEDYLGKIRLKRLINNVR